MSLNVGSCLSFIVTVRATNFGRIHKSLRVTDQG